MHGSSIRAGSIFEYSLIEWRESEYFPSVSFFLFIAKTLNISWVYLLLGDYCSLRPLLDCNKRLRKRRCSLLLSVNTREDQRPRSFPSAPFAQNDRNNRWTHRLIPALLHDTFPSFFLELDTPQLSSRESVRMGLYTRPDVARLAFK